MILLQKTDFFFAKEPCVYESPKKASRYHNATLLNSRTLYLKIRIMRPLQTKDFNKKRTNKERT